MRGGGEFDQTPNKGRKDKLSSSKAKQRLPRFNLLKFHRFTVAESDPIMSCTAE